MSYFHLTTIFAHTDVLKTILKENLFLSVDNYTE